MTTKKTSQISNWGKTDPIGQTMILMENLNTILNNLQGIMNNSADIADSSNVFYMPCEVAKFTTDKICNANHYLKKGVSFTNSQLTKLKDISEKAEEITEEAQRIKKKQQEGGGKLKKNKRTDFNKSIHEIVNVSQNIKKLIQSITTKQVGGKNTPYNYIINPDTGRKVKIHSYLGKKIIKNYIKNI